MLELFAGSLISREFTSGTTVELFHHGIERWRRAGRGLFLVEVDGAGDPGSWRLQTRIEIAGPGEDLDGASKNGRELVCWSSRRVGFTTGFLGAPGLRFSACRVEGSHGSRYSGPGVISGAKEKLNERSFSARAMLAESLDMNKREIATGSLPSSINVALTPPPGVYLLLP